MIYKFDYVNCKAPMEDVFGFIPRRSVISKIRSTCGKTHTSKVYLIIRSSTKTLFYLSIPPSLTYPSLIRDSAWETPGDTEKYWEILKRMHREAAIIFENLISDTTELTGVHFAKARLPANLTRRRWLVSASEIGAKSARMCFRQLNLSSSFLPSFHGNGILTTVRICSVQK